MTTLVFPERRLDGALGPSSILSLHEWLGERWAVLFSHPDDFDQEQLERDRWLSVLSRSFSEHDVRAVALARHGYDTLATSLGWLAALGDGCAAVLWSRVPPRGALLDFRASALRAEIAHGGDRFAMIIDSDLRCRRGIRYDAATELPSPIELVGWAVALRERQLCHPSKPGRDDYSPVRHSMPPHASRNEHRSRVADTPHSRSDANSCINRRRNF